MKIGKLLIGWDKRRETGKRIKYEDSIREAVQSRQLTDLLKNASIAIANAKTLDESLNETLRIVCAYTGWAIGHAYHVTSTHNEGRCPSLLPTKYWYIKHPVKFNRFRSMIENLILEDCEGLSGHVYANKQYHWIPDLSDPGIMMPRLEVLIEAGLVSAFAFPVFVNNKIHAVLEFYSTQALNINPDFLDAVAHIGKLLGYLVEQKWAEEALRNSETKFRSIFEGASVGIILSDSTGLITSMNRATTYMFGCQDKELVGKPLSIILPKRLQKEYADWFAKIKTGETVKGKKEFFAVKSNGEEFPIEISVGAWSTGLSQMYFSFVRDLSEREYDQLKIKEKTRELEESEEALWQQTKILYSILDESNDGIAIIDKNLKWLFFNPTAERLLDFSQDFITEKFDIVEWSSKGNVFKADGVTLYRPDDLPLVRALHGEKVEKEVIIHKTESGTNHIETSCIPLKSQDGSIPAAVAIFREIKEV
jgi:PAS domain S-box-containing protein